MKSKWILLLCSAIFSAFSVATLALSFMTNHWVINEKQKNVIKSSYVSHRRYLQRLNTTTSYFKCKILWSRMACFPVSCNDFFWELRLHTMT